VTEDVHVIAAVFANGLGDVIGALIAAVAPHARKALAYATSSSIEESPTGRLFFYGLIGVMSQFGKLCCKV
jgi:hypothetical protein